MVMLTKKIEFDEDVIKEIEGKIKEKIFKSVTEPSEPLVSELSKTKYETDARDRYIKLGYITE